MAHPPIPTDTCDAIPTASFPPFLYNRHSSSVVRYLKLPTPIQTRLSSSSAQFDWFSGDDKQEIHPPSHDFIDRLKQKMTKLDRDPIDQFTRFLHYSWIQREEFYPQDVFDHLSLTELDTIPRQTTDLVVGVHFGIDVIIILRLTSDLDTNSIDEELKQAQTLFRQGSDNFPTLPLLEKYSDQQKLRINVSSNTSCLNSYRYMSLLREKIHQLKTTTSLIWPILYSLYPRDDLHNITQRFTAERSILVKKHVEEMETHLMLIQSLPAKLEQCRTIVIHQVENKLRPQDLLPIQNELYQREEECQRNIRYLKVTIQDHKNHPNWAVSERELVDFDQLKQWTDECQKFIKETLKEPDNPSRPPPDSPLKKQTVNLLLLGQTGVGKSTFINALANYLKFETLELAQTGTPLVIIPVSFIITSGFYFDEKKITFGPQDPSNNENFNDQGHSVTQQCRTYTFDLPERNQHVHIIDTPGFGDTRGIEQDKINIKHINDYIAQLPHVDAICCLFKPNESKIDILFRTCFMQLFSVIGEEAYDKVMFCFTNSRSTFYAPGNTGPLLKKMLETVKNGQVVKMEKKNTFCFDNEAFRYLVARQNGVEFSDDEQQEYANSWKVSVKTANRLFQSVLQQFNQFV